MSTVKFLPWIILTAGIFVEAFGILALLTFVHNRIKHKYWEVEDTAEIMLGIIFTIAGVLLFNIALDKETRFEMFHAMKPKCQEETVSCLKKKAEWYQDSINYNMNIQTLNEKYIIDSLKNVIDIYEKGKQIMVSSDFIHYDKKYNKRHKIIIAIIALLCIAVQYLPYKVLAANDEVDHLECVEVSRMPNCASEKQYYAYEVTSDRETLYQITKYNTCYDYYTNKNYDVNLPLPLGLLGTLIILADAAAIACGLIYLIFFLISKVYDWLKEENN